MAHVEMSVVVNRPIEEVFAKATDFNNQAHWTSGLIEAVLTSPGALRAGATYRYTSTMIGQRMDTQGTVITYDAPRDYAWRATSGPFPMSGGIKCETVEGGTRVTLYVDAEPGGFFKLAEPLLMSSTKKQFEGDLQKMKTWMENQ
jgi:uncharacterized membrane protein